MDECALCREGLKTVNGAMEKYAVVGETGSAKEAIGAIKQLKPQIVTTDIRLPDMNGIEFIREIKHVHPEACVIVLTLSDDLELVLMACREGATGYLLKEDANEELSRAIAAALKGKTYICPQLSKQLLKNKTHLHIRSAREILTPREIEVLQLIAEGLTNKGTAAKLNISVKTVEVHRLHIMEKLDIHNSAGLVRYAMRESLVNL